MENTRLTKKVLDWDIKVNAEKNIVTWSSDVKDIFERNNQMDMFRNKRVKIYEKYVNF